MDHQGGHQYDPGDRPEEVVDVGDDDQAEGGDQEELRCPHRGADHEGGEQGNHQQTDDGRVEPVRHQIGVVAREHQRGDRPADRRGAPAAQSRSADPAGTPDQRGSEQRVGGEDEEQVAVHRADRRAQVGAGAEQGVDPGQQEVRALRVGDLAGAHQVGPRSLLVQEVVAADVLDAHEVGEVVQPVLGGGQELHPPFGALADQGQVQVVPEHRAGAEHHQVGRAEPQRKPRCATAGPAGQDHDGEQRPGGRDRVDPPRPDREQQPEHDHTAGHHQRGGDQPVEQHPADPHHRGDGQDEQRQQHDAETGGDQGGRQQPGREQGAAEGGQAAGRPSAGRSCRDGQVVGCRRLLGRGPSGHHGAESFHEPQKPHP